MIKLLEERNVDSVMDIWLKTNISAHSFLPESYWKGNYDIVKNEYLPNSETFIFEEQNRIKGFVSIIDKSFIGAIFVLPKFQNIGIGKKLIDFCKERYTHLELACYKENHSSVKFYKNQGFTIVAEQNNEDSGHTKLIMRYTNKLQ